MSQSMPAPTAGEVWDAVLGGGVGREQEGFRPVLVISNQGYNEVPHELVLIVPVTGTNRDLPLHLAVLPPEGGLTKPSVAICEQARAISLLRLRRKRGEVSAETLAAVQEIVAMFVEGA